MRSQISKRNCFLLVLFSIAGSLHAQDSISSRTRYGLWTMPVQHNTTINGIAVGLETNTWRGAKNLKVNGFAIELAPFSLIAGMYAIGGTIAAIGNSHTPDSVVQGGGALIKKTIFPEEEKSGIHVNGISLSAGGTLSDADLSGICVNGIVSFVNRMKGIELTGIMNLHYEFHGLMIAGLRNKTTKGHGVQIGLINSCREGKLIQIGLINRIGKRTLPLVNFQSIKPRRQVLALGGGSV